MLDQAGRNLAGRDDRVAPIVEVDHFGEQLGAKPVTIAADPVELQHFAHQATATLTGSATVRQRRR